MGAEISTAANFEIAVVKNFSCVFLETLVEMALISGAWQETELELRFISLGAAALRFATASGR